MTSRVCLFFVCVPQTLLLSFFLCVRNFFLVTKQLPDAVRGLHLLRVASNIRCTDAQSDIQQDVAAHDNLRAGAFMQRNVVRNRGGEGLAHGGVIPNLCDQVINFALFV